MTMSGSNTPDGHPNAGQFLSLINIFLTVTFRFLIAQCGLDFVRQQVPIQDEPELSLTSRFAGIDVTDTPIHVQRNRQLRSTKKELTEIQCKNYIYNCLIYIPISGADFDRKDEPVPDPETPKEFQDEFDTLIKQIQCKGTGLLIIDV